VDQIAGQWPLLAGFLLIAGALLKVIQSVYERWLDNMIKEKDRQIEQLGKLYAERMAVAEKRADLLHTEKEQLLKQLDANSQSLYRFTDAIGELRDAVRDLTRVRQA
jgi:chromosome segregation ATPase